MCFTELGNGPSIGNADPDSSAQRPANRRARQAPNEGVLNDYERAEYEALVNAEDFVAILKLKARSQLADAM
jgi:hypothetical protein